MANKSEQVKEVTDFSKLRQDFPMLKKRVHGQRLVYLDSAATAQKPQVMIDAVTSYYQENYGTVHRAIYELAVTSTQQYNEARSKAQRLLNAGSDEEIIFTRGTTESINLVAYSFGKAFIKPGDEVLITELEHHGNIVSWQLMCEDRGATIRVVPVLDNGDLDMDAYRKLLNEKTRIVAVGHIANSIGTINPIKEIIKVAHDAGTHVLVDGAQAAPHQPVDVQDLDCDFYVFSGHKLYGPTGVGVLYGRKSLLDDMPPYQGGGDMIESVGFDRTSYNTLPLKFEAGTPMIAQVLGLGAAIDYVTDIGLEACHEHEKALLDAAIEGLEQIDGLRIIGNPKERAAIISFVLEGVHPFDLGTLLDLKGIAVRTGHHCAQPTMKRFCLEATTRASFAIYNDMEDVNCLVRGVEDVAKQLST